MVQFLHPCIAELVSLLLLVSSIDAKGHADCCPAKQITAPDGFTSYFRLVQRSPTVPSVCKNSCTYQMDGNPGRKFCFAPNKAFKSECVQPATNDFSEVQCGRAREGGCLTGGNVNRNGRIIGGEEAGCNEYPWKAVILADVGLAPGAPGMPPPKFFIGGGAVVNSRHIVSAAHIGINRDTSEDFEAEALIVLLGKHDMAQLPEPAEMMFGVESIIRHPKNNEDPPGSSDIMILRLRQQVNLNVFTPLCLPPPSITTSTHFAAEKATLAGWGAIFFPDADDQDSRPIFPGKLQELDQLLTVASSEECVDWFEMQIELGKNLTSDEWLPNLQEEALFCAKSEDGVSACYGDSGSPLMHEVAPRVFQLMGIVGGGENCNDTYTVFSNVPHFHDWIVSEAGAVFYHDVSV